jgi:hypothetical protein
MTIPTADRPRRIDGREHDVDFLAEHTVALDKSKSAGTQFKGECEHGAGALPFVRRCRQTERNAGHRHRTVQCRIREDVERAA